MKASIYDVEHWLEFLGKTDDELLKLSRVDVFKATGKGGQKKNKTSNAIRLTLSYLSVTESASRSKAENIKRAIRKLRLAIALDTKNAQEVRNVLPPLSPELRPYLNTGEIKINARNPHFPIFIGFLLNSYIQNGGSLSAMGNELGFTVSQIRKFIDNNPLLKRKLSEWNNLKKKAVTPV